MNEVITVKNLSKSFGNKKVIKDLSFSVNEGEIFAFLGPNGSGKTTTLRCLLGIYQADEGQLLVNGEKYHTELSGILGYLPEERGLYLNTKVLETLVYFGQLKGLDKDLAEKRALDYLKRVELSDKATSEIKKLSSGQQQKIQLGITVINNPKILILDEPTKGLDPINRNLLMDILMDLNKKGSTIVFSTHQMEEAERIADRLVMIDKGKRALYGSVQDVKKQYGKKIIVVDFAGRFVQNDDLYSARIEKNSAELKPKENVESSEILKFLVKEGVQISKFVEDLPSLNEIFIEVVNKDNN